MSLLGVINLRGHVVPVYDLRVPFELPQRPERGRAPSVLIVEIDQGNESSVTGLFVDRVSDVLEFSPEEVKPAPQLGTWQSDAVRSRADPSPGWLLARIGSWIGCSRPWDR